MGAYGKNFHTGAVRSHINKLLFKNEIESHNQLYYGYAKYARSYGGYALSTSTKVLLRRDCALSTKGPEVLEGVRRMLEAVENCALYAVGTAGDALCAEVVEVVRKMVEVVLKVAEVRRGCTEGGWGLCGRWWSLF